MNLKKQLSLLSLCIVTASAFSTSMAMEELNSRKERRKQVYLSKTQEELQYQKKQHPSVLESPLVKQPNSLFGIIIEQFPYGKIIKQKVNLKNLTLNDLAEFENSLDQTIMENPLVFDVGMGPKPAPINLQRALIIANSLATLKSEEIYRLLKKPQNINQLCKSVGNIVLSSALNKISTQESINFLNNAKFLSCAQLRKNPLLAAVCSRHAPCIITLGTLGKKLSHIMQKNYGLQLDTNKIIELKTNQRLDWQKECNKWDKKYGNIRQAAYKGARSLQYIPFLSIATLIGITIRKKTVTQETYYSKDILYSIPISLSMILAEILISNEKIANSIINRISKIHHKDLTAQNFIPRDRTAIIIRKSDFATYSAFGFITLDCINFIKYSFSKN